jgi:hypothetical protein
LNFKYNILHFNILKKTLKIQVLFKMMMTQQSLFNTILLALLGSSIALPQLRNPDRPDEKKNDFEPMLVEYKNSKKTYFPLQVDQGYVTCSSSIPWWMTATLFTGAHCFCILINNQNQRIECTESPAPVRGLIDGRSKKVCHLQVYKDGQGKVNRCVVRNMNK